MLCYIFKVQQKQLIMFTDEIGNNINVFCSEYLCVDKSKSIDFWNWKGHEHMNFTEL